MTKVIKMIEAGLLTALLTGCMNSNPRITLNVLTSRSSAIGDGGASNFLGSVTGMEGGGTVSPETTLTKP